MIRTLWRLLTAHVDWLLLAAIGSTIGVGLTVLYSAAAENMARVSGQLASIGLAGLVMWAVANTHPRYLSKVALPLYVIGVLSLIAVALFGQVINGARRWLNLGITIVQPSEISKVAVPLMLAWYFEKRQKTLGLLDHAIGALFLVVPVALVARQPDLGTALMITASGFYVVFLAGLSVRVMATLAALLGAAAPVLWSLMHDYQRQRIQTLFDPSQDPLGAGYHTLQSMIAVGSGGLFGKGWLHGTQAHLDFLPERSTDFIFAVFSEEFGLVGIGVLLLLYLAIIARGLVIAANASTLFGRLLAGSISLTFMTYAFVNMGMVSGILPVVGVPLPLISYGGTSMVTLLLGFGILMSIETHKKLVST